MRPVLLVATGLIAVLLLAGCEASVSTGGGIDSEEVAEQAQTQLSKASEERGGPPYPEVECPDQLDEEKGARMTCFADFDGKTHKVSVEVTKVGDDGGNLHFVGDLPSK